MKKISAIKILASLGVIAVLGVSVSSVGGNRWESRMTKSTTTGTKSTMNLRSGKKINEDGSQSAAATPVPAAVAEYGEGTLHCRDTVLKLNTNFESAASPGTSEVRVAEMNHGTSKTMNCMDVKPSLVNASGNPVNGGTLTVKCNNGQMTVTASNCTAPTPTPAVSPTVDPNAPPAPTPPPPAGQTVRACNAWCSDGTATCTRTSNSKGQSSTRITYRTCNNGQYYVPSTGACASGSKPANCY